MVSVIIDGNKDRSFQEENQYIYQSNEEGGHHVPIQKYKFFHFG